MKFETIKNKRPDFSKDEYIALVVTFFATAFRLFIMSETPIVATIQHPYDDQMMAIAAVSLANGEWLGAATKNTLVKNIGYPITLVLSSLLHIRYQLLMGILMVLAALAFVIAIKPLVPKLTIRCCIFIFILYTPALFTFRFFQRLYRMGLSVPVVTLFFSGYLGMYLRRDEPAKRLLIWGLTSAFSGSLFWVITESGYFVVPFVVCCSLVLVGYWARQSSAVERALPFLIKRIVLLAIPPLAIVGLTFGIRLMNESYYGVHLLDNNYEGNFARVKQQLLLIDGQGVSLDDFLILNNTESLSPDVEPYVDGIDIWVSRYALAAAISNSPSLILMSDELQISWMNWIDKIHGEAHGDMGFWALRNAYDDAFTWNDEAEAEEYWGRVADELEQAFREGKLQRYEGTTLSTTAKPIAPEYWGLLISRSITNCAELVWGNSVLDDRIGEVLWEPGGPEDLQQEVANLLGGNVLTTLNWNPEEYYIIHTIDRVICRLSLVIERVAFVLMIPCLVAACVISYRQCRRRTVELVLSFLGLLLSGLALVVGVTWGYMFWSITSIYTYCSAFYALIMMAQALAIGVLVCGLDRETLFE